MLKRPRTLELSNVMLYSFTSNISNTSKKLSGAPEMSFSEMSLKPLMLFKDCISRISFKKLQCFRNAHCTWNLYKQMYGVWLYTKLIDYFKTIFNSNILNRGFTKFSYFTKFKLVTSIFEFPNEVKCILTNTMSKVINFHFSNPCAKFKNTAHTKLNCDAYADSSAHTLYSFKNLRMFGLPRVETQGILCT